VIPLAAILCLCLGGFSFLSIRYQQREQFREVLLGAKRANDAILKVFEER